MQEQEPERGIFTDTATLFSLVWVSFQDAARLLGLEAHLVVKTLVMMVLLGVLLGLVMAGIWLSITLMVIASLYEYTGLGMMLSICAATLINVVCAAALFLTLKRLAHRLTFPQTRLAVRTLLEE
ncbi:hypothetical protein [Marinospirillum sp.]|uniref:hypothetical protein n=1 Tax=Marinospirillum sp. TaxID=2183934 RepID=UPI00286FDE8C|nr:hypothetical protein [Marinospirillum sp.]MDR9468449.1 hypothetical protein [Marinospirillum sp.]